MSQFETIQIGKMTWHDAVDYCEKNPQWKLPTRKQLNEIYKNLHKSKLLSFKETYYWTVDELSLAYAWSLNFETGVLHYYTKMHKNEIILIKNGI
jgi:hypothetical protein